MVLMNRVPGKVIEHKSDTDGHWLMVIVEIFDQKLILLCVYGYNNRIKNRVTLERLGLLINE